LQRLLQVLLRLVKLLLGLERGGAAVQDLGVAGLELERLVAVADGGVELWF
jgi:hypothetical protein